MGKRKKVEFDSITTRGGDDGKTSLYDGSRRRKDDLVFEILGGLDELNSWLGLIKHYTKEKKNIEQIQKDLFKVGAMFATPINSAQWDIINYVNEFDVGRVEKYQSRLMKQTKISHSFALPGGNEKSAKSDIARTVCRRVERSIVSYIMNVGSHELKVCQNYINRISDYLFVVARSIEQ